MKRDRGRKRFRDSLRRIDFSQLKWPSFWAFVYWVVISVSGFQEVFLGNEIDISRLAVARFFHLIFLILIFNLIFLLVRLAKKSPVWRRVLKNAIIYFLILSLFLILGWPGFWSFDDIGVLSYAQNMTLLPWQHFLSSVFMIFSILTIPLVVGPIVMQMFFASLMVGFITGFVPEILAKGRKQYWGLIVLCFLPFLFPPVIYYALTGFRISLYQYLEVFVLVLLFVMYKREKIRTNWVATVIFLIATVLLCAWRSEGIYYVVGVPLILLCFGKEKISRRRVLIYFLIIGVVSFGIGRVNQALIKSKKYTISATMAEAASIMKGAEAANNAEDLAVFEPIFDLECAKGAGGGYQPEAVFWECYEDAYSEGEYNAYLKSLIPLSLKYNSEITDELILIIRNGLTAYQDELGIPTAMHMQFNAIDVMEHLDDSDYADTWNWNLVESPLSRPFSKSVRRKTIRLLSGLNGNNTANAINVVFWNLIPPILLAILALVITILRRDKITVLVLLLVSARLVLVTVASMSWYFMYYLDFYLSAYLISFVSLFLSFRQGFLRNGEKKN